MNHPHFLDYGRPWLGEEEIQAVTEVLRGTALTQGPVVRQFESELARKVGAPHAVSVASGTAALHIASLALGLGPGDAVLVPAQTFAATANALLYVRATPVFADIDPRTLCVSVETLRRALEEARRGGLRPRAIYVVHYAGRPCPMEEIWEFAERQGLVVVEDACHALGAELHLGGTTVPVGGSPRSAFVVYSFHPVKHITTGEGGALSTFDESLARRARALSSHGIVREPALFQNHELAWEPGQQGPNPWYHEMQMLGLNYRMSDVVAALGRAQLGRLGPGLERRRAIAERYRRDLASLEGLTLPPGDSESGRHAYHLFALRLDFERLGRSRKSVMEALRARGIGSQVHYLPVPWHPYYRDNPGLWLGRELPEAARFYRSTLSIPLFPQMTEDDVGRVVTALAELLA